MEKSNSNSYLAIGLMSGTSLDGLDIVAAQFNINDSKWTYEILASDCIPYSPTSKEKLVRANTMNAAELMQLHTDYGQWIGKVVVDFLGNNGISQNVDVIGSHGHTVLHQPQNGFTLQIGSGADARTTFVCPATSHEPFY